MYVCEYGHLPKGTPCLIWGIQGSCDRDVCAIFYPLLEVTSLKNHVCVKDSSAEGTCFILKMCTYPLFSTAF